MRDSDVYWAREYFKAASRLQDLTSLLLQGNLEHIS